MSKAIGVAEVKRRFSEVIGEVSRDGEQIIIQKNHKPIAALVSLKDFEIVKKSGRREENMGLLAAIGAWEDFEDIDRLIKHIYIARKKAKDRIMKGLS
jgi:prevent-host-death family protein